MNALLMLALAAVASAAPEPEPYFYHHTGLPYYRHVASPLVYPAAIGWRNVFGITTTKTSKPEVGHNFIRKADDWDYRPCIAERTGNTCSTDYAPPNWGVSTGDGVCGTGTRQSPINIPIDHDRHTEVDYPQLRFENWDITPGNATLKNSGHNLEYDLNIKPPQNGPKTSGGGLVGTYILDQGHFHWGCVDSAGSEHKINNFQYPMELHLVHHKSTFATSREAQNSGTKDGLAVLSILFEVQPEDNPSLTPIITALHDETAAEAKPVPVHHKDPLVDLLPKNKNLFFRYYGSLTTPPCNEAVVWTVFKDAVGISVAQLQAFRQVQRNWEPCGKEFGKCETTCRGKCEKGIPLVNNFRPIQDLNGRDVFDVDTTGVFYF